MKDQWQAIPPDADLLVLVLAVHDRRLGVPAEGVVELLRVVEHTVLPDAPGVIDGVINVRGTVVAVIDLRSRLGLPYRAPQLTDHLVLATVGSRLVALRVDRAVDLVLIAAEQLQAATAFAGSEPLVGVAALPDGLLLIHDFDGFLSVTAVADLDRALSSVEGR